jgi:3-oxoacyl-[acyl-carrier protein] reductase
MARTAPQSGRNALVTGASRGIGKEIALRLASRGFSVVLNYRASAERAEEVLQAVRSRGGDGLLLQADISDPVQAAKLVMRAEHELGPLDLLVNNAGITRDRLLIQMTEEDWADTWMTNFTGARAAARSALGFMRERGSGSIVNVSSVVAAIGNAGQANYAAAKAAIHGLTRDLAVQAAASNISVNCVVPGYIVTDATAQLSERQRDVWLRRIPMRRPATPAEVAETVLFLGADQTGYITGQCLAVDGGLLAAAGFGLAS